MGKRIERTAEILDTGDKRKDCFKTGQGAVFLGKDECERELEKLRRLDAGRDARFIVDWHGEDGLILDTFGLDENGFRALTGQEPLSTEEYATYDADYWAERLAGRA